MFGTVSMCRSSLTAVAFCVGVFFSDCLAPIAFSRLGSSSVAWGACLDADEVRAWYAAAMRKLTSIAVTYTGVEDLPSEFPLNFNPNTGAHMPDPEAIKRRYPGGGDWFSRSEGLRKSRRPTRYWDGHRYVPIVKSAESTGGDLVRLVGTVDPCFADTVGPSILGGFRLSQCLSNFEQGQSGPNSTVIRRIIEDGQSNWRDVMGPVSTRHGFDTQFVAEIDVAGAELARRGPIQHWVATRLSSGYAVWNQSSGLEVVDELLELTMDAFRRVPVQVDLFNGAAIKQLATAVDFAFLSPRSSRRSNPYRKILIKAHPMDNVSEDQHADLAGQPQAIESQEMLRTYSGDRGYDTRAILRYACVIVLIVNALMVPRLVARFGSKRHRKSRRRSRHSTRSLLQRWMA
ncbi:MULTISPECIES: hypothetical protein [unclassified Schlesneria]|uniref:hypothetical protein n=1 Tax=Schlesneria TaxID=656899 RepID=UPI002EE5748E